jgi:hypothetical protein
MWYKWFLAVVVIGVLVGACGRGSKTPKPNPTPTLSSIASPTPTAVVTPSSSPTPVATPSSTPSETASPSPAPTQDSQAEVRDYLALVFPPGPGRDDVFLVCTSCHGIQVIILAGPLRDRSAWEATRERHDMGAFAWARPGWQGRQESQDALWEYLIEHFGPDKPPPPPLPEGLRTGWQVY